MNRKIYGQKDRWLENGQKDKKIDGQMDRKIFENKKIDGRKIDGQKDIWIERQMNRKIDEQKDR